ncbi:MAG: glycoside hydrolase family 3 N-terminal domain-containing protein [Scytonema sp. PMC 1069.18]|nr:glycoside hydrolase family 3 N-terminal domain-containing protein [Scytonema sp. PMC 1069.18]MEC4885965.1 glycoside hydrolase family 3 N-terminal domain-containing protein [Scytonema sp. PMC 1070.18]
MLPDIDKLSLAEQVAQMVVVRASGFLFDHQIQYPAWEPPAVTLQHWIQDLGVSGVILVGASAGELAIRTNQLQNWAKIPLLIAADIEEGVGQRFTGATWFPPPMALSTIFRKDQKLGLYYAEQMGAITAIEALEIGINWVLAPILDVNNNPDNPVINVRAFGETTQEVSQLACAFIRGAKNHPVLTTAKHFPGHGDTAIDSHLELPVIPHSEDRLLEVELPPFEAAIAAGVDSVMSAHLLIPSWDAQRPATLSQKILTGQLRQTMGFNGLVTTDALVMGAIADRYGAREAPVMAVEAGADILLMTVDPEAAIDAVCQAVESGRISPTRIRESVERIWLAKGKVCLNPVNPTRFVEQVARTEASKTVAEILQHSQIIHGSATALENLINAIKVNNSSNLETQNLIVVDHLLLSDFLNKTAPAIVLPNQMGYKTEIIESDSQSIASLKTNSPTLLQMFIRGNPFRGSAKLTNAAEELFKKLLTNGNLQGFVLYGSPYVLQQFIPLLPAHIPAIFSYGQMPTAQDSALRTLFRM